MYQAGGTIKTLVGKIAEQEYLLPAIQREFVWRADQICELFDSILQGYPFGTFLFWKIKPENRAKYQFYDFVRHYHERDRRHCEKIENLPDQEFTAVLDGQQRMTALNVGLRGSYSWKLQGKWWRNDSAFPDRKLFLDLLGLPDDQSGLQYQFHFLTVDRANQKTDGSHWLRVGRILEGERDNVEEEIDQELDHLPVDERRRARRTLRVLLKSIYDQPKVSYYEEDQQDLERVLNIFIRMNSGGTPLSYSDLLLSIAVAQWNDLDAREEVHDLVDQMNNEGDGFAFSKDLVLKAGLMLSDIGNIGFKVENFNKQNMERLEGNWNNVRESLLHAVRLLASFGFNGQNIRAASGILPIAYYIHLRGLDETYLSSSRYVEDRDKVKRWFIKSILKASGIWGSGLDTLLSDIRGVIREHGSEGFPIEGIESAMSLRGKSLQFSEEEVDELAEISYGDRRTFSLLSIIFPGFDFSRHMHVDHIYPRSRCSVSKWKNRGFSEEEADELSDKADRLPNLQLMEGTINNEKRQMLPHEWYSRRWPNEEARQRHLEAQAIEELAETFEEFPAFYGRRYETLKARISHELSQ